MSSALSLNYKDYVDYNERCEIQIDLKKQITSEDYKTLTGAINTIASITEKYIKHPEPKKEQK